MNCYRALSPLRRCRRLADGGGGGDQQSRFRSPRERRNCDRCIDRHRDDRGGGVGQAGETTAAAAAIVLEESSWVCGVGGARAPPDCAVAVPAVVVVTPGRAETGRLERDEVIVPPNLFLLCFY